MRLHILSTKISVIAFKHIEENHSPNDATFYIIALQVAIGDLLSLSQMQVNLFSNDDGRFLCYLTKCRLICSQMMVQTEQANGLHQPLSTGIQWQEITHRMLHLEHEHFYIQGYPWGILLQ